MRLVRRKVLIAEHQQDKRTIIAHGEAGDAETGLGIAHINVRVAVRIANGLESGDMIAKSPFEQLTRFVCGFSAANVTQTAYFFPVSRWS
jgi:hypothetical protein